VKLDPVAFILCIDEAEGVAAEPVHIAVGGRNAPVTHDNNGNLVQCLRQRGPEVPVVFGAAQVGAGVPLDGMVKVRELKRVPEEKYGRTRTTFLFITVNCLLISSGTAMLSYSVLRKSVILLH
jgi:hypothetical protein